MFLIFKVVNKILILLILINILVFYYAYFGTFNENKVQNSEKLPDLYQEEQYFHHNAIIIPILVISCQRALFLNRTLTKLFQYHPRRNNIKSNSFPIIVSHACNDGATKKIIQSFQENIFAVLYYNQNVKLLQEKIERSGKYKQFVDPEMIVKYSQIADHYHTAFNWTFGLPIDKNKTRVDKKIKKYNFKKHDAVIVIEDDLEISPDFYEYFNATYTLLQRDSTLYCISAWNDNGKLNLIDINATSILYRTDFFPGLGWMMKKTLWLELEINWPEIFWDEYLRKPNIRKERQCIRPEISRTFTFGDVGVSESQYYERHLQKQYLNNVSVNFSSLNLDYLISQNYLKSWLITLKFKCIEMTPTMILKRKFLPPFIKVIYQSKSHYSDLAATFNLFPDLKEGMPRASYMGIVTFKYKNSRIYLYPRKLEIIN